MSEIIILPVLGRHFHAAAFHVSCFCPIAKAAKEYFKTENVYEDLNRVEVNYITYVHKSYHFDNYLADNRLASAAGYDETIIFNLELKEVV